MRIKKKEAVLGKKFYLCFLKSFANIQLFPLCFMFMVRKVFRMSWTTRIVITMTRLALKMVRMVFRMVEIIVRNGSYGHEDNQNGHQDGHDCSHDAQDSQYGHQVDCQDS